LSYTYMSALCQNQQSSTRVDVFPLHFQKLTYLQASHRAQVETWIGYYQRHCLDRHRLDPRALGRGIIEEGAQIILGSDGRLQAGTRHSPEKKDAGDKVVADT